MIEKVCVIGAGRVGSAIAARLGERGVGLVDRGAPTDLVLICVPDRAIATVARELEAGPWVAHVSGATPLAALAPHVRRFGVHPLQTIVRRRGPEQLDGAYAAVTGETEEACETGTALAEVLGLRPFALADGEQALYHAGASLASPLLVTLYREAAALFELAGAPPEALLPLMQRTIDNGFEVTGPIARGDWETVEAHLRAIRERRPQLEPLYRALVQASAA